MDKDLESLKNLAKTWKNEDLEILKNWTKAGKIAAEALEYGRGLIKEGAEVSEILAKIEAKIVSLEGGIAFPAQISLNETAAHGCPDFGERIVLAGQLVKLDIGAHIDGWVADTALTVNLSKEHKDIVKASEESLKRALKIIKPGVKLYEIGAVVEETILGYGYKPVRNLSGHGLGQFIVHDAPTIPNFDNGSQEELEDGQIVAIETFASAGSGVVQEKGKAGVLMLLEEKPVRDAFTRQILQRINSYQGLPFAKRWLANEFGVNKVNFAFAQLNRLECLREFPPLVDTANGWVSQAEHTIMVGDKLKVLTERN